MNFKIKSSSKQNSSLAKNNYRKHLRLLPVLGFIAVANVLASCNGNNSSGTATQVSTAKYDSVVAVKNNAESQNTAAHAEIDALTSRNAVLDSQIKRKDIEIAALKNKVHHLEKNNKALAAKLKKDDNLISSLKDELNDNTKTYSDRIGVLENEKAALVREKAELQSKYASLKELGSVLHASNIRISALHLKHHGTTEKNTRRAKKTDVLKIYFDIDENRIAEDGSKQLYLVIKDPNGTLLSSNEGPAMTTSNGNKMGYTILKQIALKQNEPVKNVAAEWKQDGDYQKGVYSVAIYNGGYKIGGGDVTLN